jgi:hypothetical protein
LVQDFEYAALGGQARRLGRVRTAADPARQPGRGALPDRRGDDETARHPPGTAPIGVDKGYTEVSADSDGIRQRSYTAMSNE